MSAVRVCQGYSVEWSGDIVDGDLSAN
jgi:hypothetical protein